MICLVLTVNRDTLLSVEVLRSVAQVNAQRGNKMRSMRRL